MKVRKYCLKLDKYEQGVMLKALDCYRKKLEQVGEDSYPVCKLIIKIADTKPKKLFC